MQLGFYKHLINYVTRHSFQQIVSKSHPASPGAPSQCFTQILAVPSLVVVTLPSMPPCSVCNPASKRSCYSPALSPICSRSPCLHDPCSQMLRSKDMSQQSQKSTQHMCPHLRRRTQPPLRNTHCLQSRSFPSPTWYATRDFRVSICSPTNF